MKIVMQPGTDGCWRDMGRPGPGTCPELRQHVVCSNCPHYAEAALRLLDRPAPVEYVREWTDHLAAPPADVSRGTAAVVVFRLGSEWLSIPANLVEQIAETARVHALPHRPSPVRGLVSVRGDLVICVSLHALLGVERAAVSDAPAASQGCRRLVVLNAGGGRIAFEADEIFGLHRYDPAALTTPPSTLSKAAGDRFTSGLFPWRDRSVGALDGDRVLASLSRSFS
jgi:chemotaxis-related protein WspD